MKRLVTAVATILVVAMLAAGGCTNKSLVSPAPESEQEIVSSCVTCHTDKDILKEVATTEEKAKSAETTGEG